MARRLKKRVAKRRVRRRPTTSARRESVVVPPPSQRLHNLPVQLTSFIGREQEIAEVKRLLDTTRFLTLTGSGGCGKTRLALQVAAELLEQFPDGVWLAELATLSDPSLVPNAVASALSVPEQPGRGLTEALTDSLRPKSALVILDNIRANHGLWRPRMKALAILGSILLMATIGVAAQAPVVQQPVWATGDTWTYRGIDGKSFSITVTGVSEDHWSLLTQGEGQPRHVALLKFDFSPNTHARFSWPLELNKQWTYTFTGQAVNAKGGQNQWSTTSLVESFESVVVPAGTFDAFRVRGHECNTTQQKSKACGDFAVWYAPEVKNYVKLSYFTAWYFSAAGKSTELLSYQLH